MRDYVGRPSVWRALWVLGLCTGLIGAGCGGEGGAAQVKIPRETYVKIQAESMKDGLKAPRRGVKRKTLDDRVREAGYTQDDWKEAMKAYGMPREVMDQMKGKMKGMGPGQMGTPSSR